MLVYRSVTPSINSSVPIYIPVERGIVRVKCLAQEHNTMALVRARTRTAHSGVERTNHGDTTAPYCEGIFFLTGTRPPPTPAETFHCF